MDPAGAAAVDRRADGRQAADAGRSAGAAVAQCGCGGCGARAGGWRREAVANCSFAFALLLLRSYRSVTQWLSWQTRRAPHRDVRRFSTDAGCRVGKSRNK
ncbi:hypothetical protein LUTEI9C_150096 [Luteimonas sp. 9C]|nr:hypothetical protein LUTEI9C_150096 [Luteimonas sp. 9C]